MGLSDQERRTSAAAQRAMYNFEPGHILPVMYAFTALTTLALAIRIYIRVGMLRTFGWDDVLLLFSYAFYLAFNGCVMAAMLLAFDPGPVVAVKGTIMAGLGAETSYFGCVVFIKLALATLYLRIIKEPWQRRFIYVSMGIFTGYTAIPFFLNLFRCGVPEINHMLHNYANHTCVSWKIVGPINYISAASNCVADWIMTIIPAFVIGNMMMPKREKFCAAGLVVLGAFASIISVARIPLVKSMNFEDVGALPAIILLGWVSFFETSIAIIAMSASTYRPLYRQIRDFAKRFIRSHVSPTASKEAGPYVDIEKGPLPSFVCPVPPEKLQKKPQESTLQSIVELQGRPRAELDDPSS